MNEYAGQKKKKGENNGRGKKILGSCKERNSRECQDVCLCGDDGS